MSDISQHEKQLAIGNCSQGGEDSDEKVLHAKPDERIGAKEPVNRLAVRALRTLREGKGALSISQARQGTQEIPSYSTSPRGLNRSNLLAQTAHSTGNAARNAGFGGPLTGSGMAHL